MSYPIWQYAAKHFRRLYRSAEKWQDDDGGMLAASVAYYAVFSMLPILMVLVAVLGLVLRLSAEAQDAQQRLLDVLADNLSPTVAEQVGRLLAEVSTQALVSGPFGLLMLLMAAIGIFAQFERAFELIFKVEHAPRSIWASIRAALWDRLRAFLILLGVGLAAVLLFVASVAMSTVQPLVERLPAGAEAWRLLQIPAMIVPNWGLATIIYRVLPKVSVPWREAARGGLLAALLWEISRQAMSLMLTGGRYSAYGVIGSLIILMLWVYVASCVLFLGAEYVQVLGEDRKRA